MNAFLDLGDRTLECFDENGGGCGLISCKRKPDRFVVSYAHVLRGLFELFDGTSKRFVVSYTHVLRGRPGLVAPCYAESFCEKLEDGLVTSYFRISVCIVVF